MRLLPGRSVHTLTGAYALDSVRGRQLARFERHLRRCDECTDEVRGFTATTAMLGLAVAARPPADLKGRVLALVDALGTARQGDPEIAAVLAAPDARTASAATSAGGTATVVASRTGAAMVFTSSGLPVLPSSRVYELWFIGAGGARPAGLVPPATAGAPTPPVFASGLAGDDSIGITVEPAGGVPAPTTTPIVVMTVPA